MKSTYRNVFDCSVDTYWNVFFTDDYNQALYLKGMRCTRLDVVEQTGDIETGLHRVVESAHPIDAPGPVKKVFGSEFAYREEGTFDPHIRHWKFELVPSRMTNRIKILGDLWGEERDDGRMDQVVDLECHIRIIGVAGIFEHFMDGQSDATYKMAAKFTNEWLRDKGLAVEG